MAVTRELLGGRYLLEELIARGGMGEVWRARDEVLGRLVAVKLLNDGLAEDGRAAERFRREAMTAAQISHPNMANVFDYVEESGRPGIVMELVPNETLAQRLARGPLDVTEAIAITDAILAALEAAHSAGIVHRDIKPANILLTPNGTVKVADFGIARSLSDSSLTQTGAVMGTAHYSAPEQVQGRSATPSTDLYSAGVVLYEMLTGARPFTGDTPLAVALARLSDDPVPIMEHRPDIPERLAAVVMRALARDPAKRYKSAHSMRTALSQAGATFLDRTAALPIDPDETVVLHSGAEPALKERRPLLPPWAGARLVKFFAPLLLVALLAWGLIAWMSGPTTTKVPSFVGLTKPAAEDLASKNGLSIEWSSKYNSAPKDTVLSQGTDPNLVVDKGTTVPLTFSRGPAPCCVVPDLTGMTVDEAQAALAGKNLELVITYQKTTSGEDDTILSQNPTGGARLNPGNEVDVTVSQLEAKHRKHGHD